MQTITAKSTRQTLKNVKKTATKQAKKAVSSVKGGSNLGSTWYGPDRPKFLGELSSAHGYLKMQAGPLSGQSRVESIRIRKLC